MMGDKRPTSSTTAVDMSDEMTDLRDQLAQKGSARYPEIDPKEMDRANRSAEIYGAGYLVLTNGRWQSFCGEEVKIIRKTNYQSEITRLRAQLAAAEADKLAAMERVRARAIKIAKDCVGVHYGPEVIATTLRDLDLDALADGEK